MKKKFLLELFYFLIGIIGMAVVIAHYVGWEPIISLGIMLVAGTLTFLSLMSITDLLKKAWGRRKHRKKRYPKIRMLAYASTDSGHKYKKYYVQVKSGRFLRRWRYLSTGNELENEVHLCRTFLREEHALEAVKAYLDYLDGPEIIHLEVGGAR